jgi:glycosyltransferase involved in cell wall biosynthesis
MPVSISVIIPTHERPGTCAVAVQSALAQSRPPLEVIVSCDGCEPDAVDALRALEGPVRVVDLPKAPGYGYGNRNEAMSRARGDVISWLGDDDLYLPDHLERIGEHHDAAVADLVQATCCNIRADGFMEAAGDDWSVPWNRERLLAGERVGPPASGVSHRAEVARAVGGWNAEMTIGGDLDLWRRLIAHGVRLAMVATPTVLTLAGTGRNQPLEERVEQNRSVLARLSDPDELLRLRAEMAYVGYRRLADHQHEAYHLRRQVEALGGEVALQRALEPWSRVRKRILPFAGRLGGARKAGR